MGPLAAVIIIPGYTSMCCAIGEGVLESNNVIACSVNLETLTVSENVKIGDPVAMLTENCQSTGGVVSLI